MSARRDRPDRRVRRVRPARPAPPAPPARRANRVRRANAARPDLQGERGPQGVAGAKGDPGAQGPIGPQGNRGEKGDAGTTLRVLVSTNTIAECGADEIMVSAMCVGGAVAATASENGATCGTDRECGGQGAAGLREEIARTQTTSRPAQAGPRSP